MELAGQYNITDFTGQYKITEIIDFKKFLERHGYKIDVEFLPDGVRLKWYRKEISDDKDRSN